MRILWPIPGWPIPGWPIPAGTGRVAPAAVGPGEIGNPRHVDLVIAIAVPVRARDDVGVVRMRHGHDEAEGPLVFAACDVKELLPGGHDHFVIEVDLVGARAGARLRD